MLLHLSMVCQTSSLQSNPYASLHLQACLTTNDSRPFWQTLYNQVVLGVKTKYSVSSQHKSPTSELPLGKILSPIPLIQLLISCTLNGTLTQQVKEDPDCMLVWLDASQDGESLYWIPYSSPLSLSPTRVMALVPDVGWCNDSCLVVSHSSSLIIFYFYILTDEVVLGVPTGFCTAFLGGWYCGAPSTSAISNSYCWGSAPQPLWMDDKI